MYEPLDERELSVASRLSESQLRALKLAVAGKNLLVTGLPGVGKSFWVEVLYEIKSARGERISVTSTSSASANVIQINGTMTFHRFMALGLGRDSVAQMVASIQKRQYCMKKFLALQCVVIDEISMMEEEYFEKMDMVLRTIRQNNNFFGGLQVIFVGDFSQLQFETRVSRVDKDAKWRSSGTKKLYDSYTWLSGRIETVLLKENQRARDDPEFFEVLDAIAVGRMSDRQWAYLSQSACTSYPGEGMRIVCTKQEVEHITIQMINRYQLEPIAYAARNYDEELCKDMPIERRVILSVGMPVVLVGTHYVKKGVPSGTMGVVERCMKNQVLVDFGPSGKLLIDYQQWTMNTNHPNAMQRSSNITSALPLLSGYAVTVHRVQGMTIRGKVFVDLTRAFAPQQGFVAISRVTCRENLSFVGHRNHFEMDGATIQHNILLRQ